MAPWTFLITLALTLYMVGMIWSMQVLEYPLFAYVGRAEFPAYHARHNRALPLLVILPSLLALLSAVLVIWSLPAGVPLWGALVVVGIDVAVVISTAVGQAPLHAKLDREGQSAAVVSRLVRSNWIRTVLWTVNALLLLGLGAAALLPVK